MRQFVRVVLVSLLSLLLVNLRPLPASAHASLLSTSPSSGADLAVAPSEVTLRFDEQVRVPSNGIRVINERAEAIDIGRTKNETTR